MADKILFTLYTLEASHAPMPLVDCLLDSLELSELVPSRWGPYERQERRYSRQEMTAGVMQLGDYAVPVVSRRGRPPYKGFFCIKKAGLHYVHLEFGPKLNTLEAERIFSFADNLAARLRPEYAIVHPIWLLGERSQAYSASGYVDLERIGPNSLCARTWLGSHIVGLIGIDLLMHCGWPVREEPWGGVRIDLVEKPWNADFHSLASAQTKVMEKLAPTGVFGHYADNPLQHRPGPAWRPIPILHHSIEM